MEEVLDLRHDERRSRTIVLPDGRRLGYAEWGDPDGSPMLFFHGIPASRLGLEWAEDAALEHGVRLLSLDRPGHGLSDRAPGRTLLGWSRDVADFADTAGLSTFAIAGWSGGGPYVLACAMGIPERLTGAAVLSGCGPFDTPSARRSVSSLDRTMLVVSSRAPLVARADDQAGGRRRVSRSEVRGQELRAGLLAPRSRHVPPAQPRPAAGARLLPRGVPHRDGRCGRGLPRARVAVGLRSRSDRDAGPLLARGRRPHGGDEGSAGRRGAHAERGTSTSCPAPATCSRWST